MEKGAFFSYDVNNGEFVHEEIIDMRVKFFVISVRKTEQYYKNERTANQEFY